MCLLHAYQCFKCVLLKLQKSTSVSSMYLFFSTKKQNQHLGLGSMSLYCFCVFFSQLCSVDACICSCLRCFSAVICTIKWAVGALIVSNGYFKTKQRRLDTILDLLPVSLTFTTLFVLLLYVEKIMAPMQRVSKNESDRNRGKTRENGTHAVLHTQILQICSPSICLSSYR